MNRLTAVGIRGEAFFCVILDDEIRIGGEVSKLADFGFNVTCNHFRNAGLIYKMLLRMNYMYRDEHGSRDWPYYIVPADHIEKEEYHSIVLKCTVEPDRFHALSGPDMPADL